MSARFRLRSSCSPTLNDRVGQSLGVMPGRPQRAEERDVGVAVDRVQDHVGLGSRDGRDDVVDLLAAQRHVLLADDLAPSSLRWSLMISLAARGKT